MLNISDRLAVVMALHEEQKHNYPGKQCVIAACEAALRKMDEEDYYKTYIEISQPRD